jgi:hypothetical protein
VALQGGKSGHAEIPRAGFFAQGGSYLPTEYYYINLFSREHVVLCGSSNHFVVVVLVVLVVLVLVLGGSLIMASEVTISIGSNNW